MLVFVTSALHIAMVTAGIGFVGVFWSVSLIVKRLDRIIALLARSNELTYLANRNAIDDPYTSDDWDI